MKKYLAAGVNDVIGQIAPPANSPVYTGNVNESLGKILSVVIQIFFVFAGFAVLIYMLLGAYEWLISAGEKEKLQKAQNKILNAVVGLILLVVVIVIFDFIMGTVLGGKFGIGPGLIFELPRIQ